MSPDKAPQPRDLHKEASVAVAEMIRQRSGQGALVSEDDILALCLAKGFVAPAPADHVTDTQSIIEEALNSNSDLMCMAADDGLARFFSTQSMTEAYAGILISKQGDPIKLIAEVVRENSRLYPRPVPVDIFTIPPFDLSETDIRRYVEQMTAERVYEDIVVITTTTDRDFLYSSHYLTHSHASLLAAWLDTGQSDNP
jgi:hypothetical protein